MKIILASASPRRKELLGYITKNFETIVSNINENFIEGLTIQEQSKRIAYLKAKEVFDKTKGDRIVIGSDTLVLKNEKPFGKKKIYKDYDIVKVYLSEITPKEIKDWINSGEAMDKAGAYAIQGQFSKFIIKLEGSYNSVVGLPVQKLYQIIKEYLD